MSFLSISSPGTRFLFGISMYPLWHSLPSVETDRKGRPGSGGDVREPDRWSTLVPARLSRPRSRAGVDDSLRLDEGSGPEWVELGAEGWTKGPQWEGLEDVGTDSVEDEKPRTLLGVGKGGQREGSTDREGPVRCGSMGPLTR